MSLIRAPDNQDFSDSWETSLEVFEGELLVGVLCEASPEVEEHDDVGLETSGCVQVIPAVLPEHAWMPVSVADLGRPLLCVAIGARYAPAYPQSVRRVVQPGGLRCEASPPMTATPSEILPV